LLRHLELDYIIGVHFPYIVPESVLEIPRVGVLNLHPALLPYNRGWHTPSWAILDETPIGATLHFMDSGVDTGDIVAQAELDIRPEDTAHTLYSRLLDLEVELFEQAWPLLASGDPPRRKQSPDEGTNHNRADLFADSVRRLDLEKSGPVEDTLRTLRALTTNDVGEAAYFETGGRRYRVQVTITPDDDLGESDN
jgi:methionyl-tRNA formyltransferase